MRDTQYEREYGRREDIGRSTWGILGIRVELCPEEIRAGIEALTGVSVDGGRSLDLWADPGLRSEGGRKCLHGSTG